MYQSIVGCDRPWDGFDAFDDLIIELFKTGHRAAQNLEEVLRCAQTNPGRRTLTRLILVGE